MEIIPAIMPIDRTDLENKVSQVRGLVPLVQIDIMDGSFVPNKSWPYWNDGYSDDFQEILNEDSGLPYWDEMDYEVDLMVSNPEAVIDDWIAAGVLRIIVHYESLKDPLAFFESLRQKFPKDGGSLLTIEIGLAIKTTTPIHHIFNLIEYVDFVQCMGIEKIGFQKQSFDDRVIGHIEALREAYPDLIISVDGGVNFDTAQELIEAGVDRLVSGSAIFESVNPLEAIEHFRSL